MIDQDNISHTNPAPLFCLLRAQAVHIQCLKSQVPQYLHQGRGAGMATEAVAIEEVTHPGSEQVRGKLRLTEGTLREVAKQEIDGWLWPCHLLVWGPSWVQRLTGHRVQLDSRQWTEGMITMVGNNFSVGIVVLA